jgi:hypothetical protein
MVIIGGAETWQARSEEEEQQEIALCRRVFLLFDDRALLHLVRVGVGQTSMGVMTRAAYLSRLRRAFLLRVHPDLFRNQSEGIRHEQSKLVKALANRMSDADFGAWQQYKTTSGVPRQSTAATPQSTAASTVLPYVIQQRDGSLLPHKLPLNRTVDDILEAMSEALRKSGAGGSLPPNLPTSPHPDHQAPFVTSTTPESTTDFVDHRYDVVSNRGRSLQHFLEHLDPQEIAQRKASRLDAQAVARQTRRLYHFQAVDATTLGWSSASVAVLLQRLLDLHSEHGHQLSVDSLHPLRLVFTHDDGHETLDRYAGVLHLSPASTPLQWLSHLRRVTPEALAEIRHRRDQVLQMQKDLQRAGGLKWNKGFSCSSRDYYHFLERLKAALPILDNGDEEENGNPFALVPDQLVTVTVEGPQVCRRPVTTREGAIRLGVDMSHATVRAALDRLRPAAAQQVVVTQTERGHCDDLAQQAQWQLGLSRLDYRQRGSILQPTHVRQCLHRLVQESTRFQSGLAGQSVGIVGSGHFCHLADDGSVMIPHDFTA